TSPGEIKVALNAAIDAGYRLIDTAATYQNEEAIGETLKEMMNSGKVTRAELFITTKKNMKSQNHHVKVQDTWRGMEDVYKKGLTKAIGVSNYSPEQIERILKTSTVPIHNCQ
ncbi:hypothetical protein TELCIR_19051, partial [Teladorsagia circumcincta]